MNETKQMKMKNTQYPRSQNSLAVMLSDVIILFSTFCSIKLGNIKKNKGPQELSGLRLLRDSVFVSVYSLSKYFFFLHFHSNEKRIF
ncbi:unnamed protein product [Gongylonema pulchrum]|uniref:Ovule protein n=1 Tax=Gongylonema pulchrum TaxID=637853 RepID=A0A183DBB5_9BILA|nr:unnamed protein product [Gongylonema pulchrum]